MNKGFELALNPEKKSEYKELNCFCSGIFTLINLLLLNDACEKRIATVNRFKIKTSRIFE